MPTARQGLAVTTGPDGKIYAAGGEGPQLRPLLSTFEVYDVQTGVWAALTSIPNPRADFGLVEGTDGRIYALGGTTTFWVGNGVGTMDVYVPATGRWIR
jgi:hypothetical protein